MLDHGDDPVKSSTKYGTGDGKGPAPQRQWRGSPVRWSRLVELKHCRHPKLMVCNSRPGTWELCCKSDKQFRQITSLSRILSSCESDWCCAFSRHSR